MREAVAQAATIDATSHCGCILPEDDADIAHCPEMARSTVRRHPVRLSGDIPFDGPEMCPFGDGPGDDADIAQKARRPAEIRIATRNSAGELIADALFRPAGLQVSGALSGRAGGSFTPALPMRPFPLAPGQEWRESVTRKDPYWGDTHPVSVNGRVEDWEQISVPAGEFRALRIVRSMSLGDGDGFRGDTLRTEWEWWVPELRAPARLIVWEEHKEPAGAFGETIYDSHLRYDLRAVHLASRPTSELVDAPQTATSARATSAASASFSRLSTASRNASERARGKTP